MPKRAKTARACVIVVAVVFGYLALPGLAQSSRPRTLYGPGTRSCGAWTADRKTESAWLGQANWLTGVVSAANMFAEQPPRETDSQAIAAWIDNYCSANPLSGLSDAVGGLLTALDTRW